MKTILKSLPQSISQEEVEESLQNQGIPFSKATRLGNKSRKFDMFMVTAPKSAEAEKIYKVNNVAHMSVTVEPKRRSKETIQCFKCQKLGHVSYRCFYDDTCVKCTGNHRSRNCPLPVNAKPKCANCEGEHLASNWSCPAHPHNYKQPSHPKRSQNQPSTQINQRRTDKTYSAVTKNSHMNDISKNLEEKMMKFLRKELPVMIKSLLQ